MSTTRATTVEERARDDEEVERLTAYVRRTCARASARGAFDAHEFATRDADAWFFIDPRRWIRQAHSGGALRSLRVMCVTTRRSAAGRRSDDVYVALAMQVFAIAGEALRPHLGSSEEADAVAARLLDVYKTVVDGDVAMPVEWTFGASSGGCDVVSFARAQIERTLPNVAFSAFLAPPLDETRRANESSAESSSTFQSIFETILDRSPSNAVRTLVFDVLLSLLLQNVRAVDESSDGLEICAAFKGSHVDLVMAHIARMVASSSETYDRVEIITVVDAPPSPFATRGKGVKWSWWTRAFLIKHALNIATKTTYSDEDIEDILTIFSSNDDLMTLLLAYFSPRNRALRARLLAASLRYRHDE